MLFSIILVALSCSYKTREIKLCRVESKRQNQHALDDAQRCIANDAEKLKVAHFGGNEPQKVVVVRKMESRESRKWAKCLLLVLKQKRIEQNCEEGGSIA